MHPNSTEMPAQYDPKGVERRLYQFWLDSGIFAAPADSSKSKYCIIMPPPNVTGVLHMGHALMCTLEDILIRWKRMGGLNALWLPGTDHAGISTQMVVERHLQKEENLSKHDLGREKFLERVWAWKEESQHTILGQMKLIGCSVDWSRLHFTLDPDVSRAVRECFARLYQEGLIYRDEAMIHWCPRCRTALSDLEVKAKEVKGRIWRIRYVLARKERFVTVATTRPETLLGDVAVAVHPDDERYRSLQGVEVRVPLTSRLIPVIADSYVDPTFGTGALKITPGHDPNDYVVGKRHKLVPINLFDDRAHLTEAGGTYRGLSREAARKQVLADLSEQGLLEGEQEHTSQVGHCDRCGTIVEPRISAQWFVNAEVLAKPAIEAVKKKEIRILPEEWEKTYFDWMCNIRPWCISRQLWWGHRIPVWYCESCKFENVEVDTPECCGNCGEKNLRQDEDVLDTWFSSGLWPISTLGWPEDTKDLRTFYPSDVMETGFDILFFWVARMIMLGIKLTGKVPFHTVYLHPMVRDEYGQKMSKTKGNVKDPLEIIDRMGADSLRFTLAAMAVHGRDVLLSDSRTEGYRNFINKLWNASRFVLLHFSEVKTSNIDWDNEVNRWVWSRLNQTKKEVISALEQYRFFDVTERLYHFVWSDFCDWFLEFIKDKDEMEKRKAFLESTALEILEETLRLLHPVMPYVTEEIWQRLPLRSSARSIAVAPFPKVEEKNNYREAENRIGRVIRIVDAIRSKRGETHLPPAASIRVKIQASSHVLEQVRPSVGLIQRFVRATELQFSDREQKGLAKHIVIPLDDAEIYIPQEDLVDTQKEHRRVTQELGGVEAELARARQKLQNAEFREKAPADVVAGVEARKSVLQKKVETLRKYLEELED